MSMQRIAAIALTVKNCDTLPVIRSGMTKFSPSIPANKLKGIKAKVATESMISILISLFLEESNSADIVAHNYL